MSTKSSLTLREMQQLADEINEKLTCKRFHRIVVYLHGNGSMAVLQNAFFMRKDLYYIIFSEHHLPIVVFQEDTEFIGQFDASYRSPQSITSKWVKKIRKEYQKSRERDKKLKGQINGQSSVGQTNEG